MNAGVSQTGLFATCYLPNINIIRAMLPYPIIQTEVAETYPKQTLRNRTTILTANGPLTLSIPVKRPQGNHTPTKQVEISYDETWNIRHWRAIASAYNTSPYFLYYRDALEELFVQHHHLLVEFNEKLLEQLFRCLKVEKKMTRTTEYTAYAQGNPDDHRDLFCKNDRHSGAIAPYHQVFSDRMPFQANMSIIDLLFNLGPEAMEILVRR